MDLRVTAGNPENIHRKFYMLLKQAIDELRRKLAEAEADLAWMEKNPDKILCLGGRWEYRIGGKGTRHDPWRWSNMRYTSLRDAIIEGRRLHGAET
jgi:hypothetical protein